MFDALVKTIRGFPRRLAIAAMLWPMTAPAQDQNGARRVEARLAGHALLPAATFVAPPEGAPAAFAASGRFTGAEGARLAVPAQPGDRSYGSPAEAPALSPPFAGQPIQGFSGVRHVGDGVFWTLSDNGFGAKANSADALLMAHLIHPDWDVGAVSVLETLFLHDPDGVSPFRLVNEFTDQRYLTGADFDIESVQAVGDRLWFGDEFGPFLLSTDLSGRLLSVHDVVLKGQALKGRALESRVLRSPDHPALRLPGRPGPVSFDLSRSRGIEGMAQSPDGTTLYPMLEGPVWDAGTAGPERRDGQAVLRILAFDVAAGAFDGRSWLYPLDHPTHAIGDFAMISATRGLVIERDGGQGDPAQACAPDAPTVDCFARPARFKRVYLIDLGAPGAMVEKRAYVDLMAIADPDGVARSGPGGDVFTFPFVTVEAVDRVDAHHIIVGNDNNLPFSRGRSLAAPDDNEWALLHVGDMLTD